MNLANRLTITRILLLPLFIGCIVYYTPERSYLRYLAISIFILAALTDFLDGFIARRLKITTDLGRILDAAIDKIFIISSFIVVSFFSKIANEIRLPFWVVLTIIARDLAVLIGVVFIYLKFNKLYIFPSKLGKFSLICEMATIISVLSLFRYSSIVCDLALFFVIISAFEYLTKALATFKKEKVSAC